MLPSLPIILIDDNPSWRETLAEFLQGRGFEVRTAEGGASGLALLENSGFVLAIIDFNMPGMSGLELLRCLRRQRRDVAVLLLSSEDDPTLAERARAEGAKAFLSKTTAPRRLLRELVQFLIAASFEVAIVAVFSTREARLLPGPSSSTRYLPAPDALMDPQRN
jgi:CheY-like chemotaxis protein